MVSSTPEATVEHRGASSVRNPRRSAIQTSGRNTGPWLEKTSRNGKSPRRIASADDANTPSSNTSDRVAKSAGSRRTTATSPRTSASTRQCRRRARESRTRRLRSASRWPSSKGTVAVREVWGAAWYGRQRSFSRSSHGRIQGLGEAHLRDRWRGIEPRQGAHLLLARAAAQGPGPAGHDAEARPLHQRRPRAR